jgi:hypothetical protein
MKKFWLDVLKIALGTGLGGPKYPLPASPHMILILFLS